MLWRSLFQLVGATIATNEDAASLLQTRKISQHSQLMYNVDKTVEVANRTAAMCSCAFNGCGLFACPPCPLIQCGCECELVEEECNCCNGNKACLQKKLKKMAHDRLRDLSSSLKYRTDYDMYKRQIDKDSRAREDWTWEHDKKMRNHVLEKRKYNDKKHRSRMASHTEERKRQGKLRKSLNTWVEDNFDNVIRAAEGARDVTTPQTIMPVCDCPKQWCPPSKGCPPCPTPKCPPCRQCRGVVKNCEPCEEDKVLVRAVYHFLNGRKMEVCPPKEDEEDYCEYKDTWPVDICPVDKEC